jgi:hypothetical protein
MRWICQAIPRAWSPTSSPTNEVANLATGIHSIAPTIATGMSLTQGAKPGQQGDEMMVKSG